MQAFPRIRFVGDRERFLEDLCREKVVLHLGCADAIHLDEHARGDRLLHLRLGRTARALHGVDIDGRAVGVLRQRFGLANVHVGDVTQLDIDFGTEFDLVIAGELIEHLQDPGRFLRSVARYMGRATTLVLTTPNLLSLKLMIYSVLGRERVHPDHVAGFTFSLLGTLLARCGYAPSAWYTTCEQFGSARNRLANAALGGLFRIAPRYGDTLMVACRKA